MSVKKLFRHNRFNSNLLKDSLEDLHKLISSKRNFIIAGSILSLGIVLGSGLESDRFAKKWLEKEINTTLQPALDEIEENKTKQITALKEELDSDLAKTNASIQAKKDELANKINEINSRTDQKLQENELIRQKIRDRYEQEIALIEGSLDRRVRKAVEDRMGTPYPTSIPGSAGCWLFGECKERSRLEKELKPVIKVQINKEVASKRQKLEEELQKDSNFEQTDEEIIAEGKKQKDIVEADYSKNIKNIQDKQETFRQEFKKQEDRLIQKAIVDQKNAEEKIEKDINREFRPTALRVAKISAILGSILGAMTTILLILLLAEYVFWKSAISDKLWFKRYKLFVLQFWAILLICCSAAISLKLFTAKTDREKEQITWIALPTARTGALISSISSLLSSWFLIQALLASNNPINKEQKIANSNSALKPPLGETKSNEIKLSLTESATTEQKQRVKETVTNIQDLPITKDLQIEDLGGGLNPTSD